MRPKTADPEEPPSWDKAASNVKNWCRRRGHTVRDHRVLLPTVHAGMLVIDLESKTAAEVHSIYKTYCEDTHGN